MSLKKLESDILAMLALSKELGKREEELMHCINEKDVYNFDPERAIIIRRKISTVNALLDNLKENWIN